MLSLQEILRIYRPRLANQTWVRAKRTQWDHGYTQATDPAVVALGLLDYQDYVAACCPNTSSSKTKEKQS